MKKDRWEMPSDVLAVHREIETWRKNREKRGPIPSSIWLAASSLAKRYGVYRIAQTLHLHYGALKRRLLEGKETDEAARIPQKIRESKGSCEFVELTGIDLNEERSRAAASGGREGAYQLEIEVSNGLGSQMTVRVLEGSGVDVSQIVREFCGRSR